MWDPRRLRTLLASTACTEITWKLELRPILTHFIETGTDTFKRKRLLESTEMNNLWKTVGKTRLDPVTRQDITQQCGIQPVGEWTLKQREEWVNHISRMMEDNCCER
jgi:hypothetical protein